MGDVERGSMDVGRARRVEDVRRDYIGPDREWERLPRSREPKVVADEIGRRARVVQIMMQDQ